MLISQMELLVLLLYSFKGTVHHIGEYAYLLTCQELHEISDTTLIFVVFILLNMNTVRSQ